MYTFFNPLVYVLTKKNKKLVRKKESNVVYIYYIYYTLS